MTLRRLANENLKSYLRNSIGQIAVWLWRRMWQATPIVGELMGKASPSHPQHFGTSTRRSKEVEAYSSTSMATGTRFS